MEHATVRTTNASGRTTVVGMEALPRVPGPQSATVPILVPAVPRRRPLLSPRPRAAAHPPRGSRLIRMSAARAPADGAGRREGGNSLGRWGSCSLS